jgi:sugar phosphate isomerase/epimerase
VTILPGTTFEGVDPDASLELAAAELRRRAARAHHVGLPLSIEPHFGSVVQTPARTQELIDLSPEIQLTLDYSHFVYQGILPGDVHPLLKHVRHFHVRPAAPRSIQTRVIDGTIEYQEIRDRLLASGYDGWFALEYQWEEAWEPGGLDFTRVDCIAETAALRDLLLHSAQ